VLAVLDHTETSNLAIARCAKQGHIQVMDFWHVLRANKVNIQMELDLSSANLVLLDLIRRSNRHIVRHAASTLQQI
jgi:hypothetical protein